MPEQVRETDSCQSGLEADQKTIAAHGCYAMTATTALTAQNTQGVRNVFNIPTSFVKEQVDACFDDIHVNALKTGMLASAETIQLVAQVLEAHPGVPSVIDPVMASSTGHQLLPQEAVKALREDLMPRATILTPNVHEAKIILKEARESFEDLRSLDDMKSVALAIQELGPCYVLLKGGHLPQGRPSAKASDKQVIDVLYGESEITLFHHRFSESSRNTHGTGCSLASAIASNLARGLPMIKAVKEASQYVHAGISTGFTLGKGNGPINHFHSLYSLPFAPGYFIDYLLERPDIEPAWKRFVGHGFVNQLAANVLPLESFKRYMVQDYLYLIQFARAHSLAAYKAPSMEDTVRENRIVLHIDHETKLHVEYCESFGIPKDELERSEETLACTAYTRFLLDVGCSLDFFALQVALAPCLLGYGEVAARLDSDPKTVKKGNPYFKWIENYVAADYRAALETGKGRSTVLILVAAG